MQTAIALLKQDIINARELLNRVLAHDDAVLTIERDKAAYHNNYFFLVLPDVIGNLGGPDTDFTC